MESQAGGPPARRELQDAAPEDPRLRTRAALKRPRRPWRRAAESRKNGSPRGREDGTTEPEMSFALWYHTVRPLRGRQILAQLRARLARYTEDPAAFARANRSCVSRRAPAAARAVPAARRARPGAGRSARRRVRVPESPRVGRLSAALERARGCRGSGSTTSTTSSISGIWAGTRPAPLALDWIERHRLASGQTGWEPYPTSLRLVNWCAFFFGEHRDARPGRRRAARRALGLDLPAGRVARAPSRNAPARQSPARERRGAAARRALLRGRSARGAGSAAGAACSRPSCRSRCSTTAATSSARRCTSCASPGCCSRCATPTRDALAPLVDGAARAPAARGRGAASPGRRDRAVQRQRLRRLSARRRR